MIQEEFRPILEELEAGRSAVLHRTVDSVEYTRLFRSRERLILLGGGHIAQPLCRMAAMLDFDVTVVDDRPDFAAASRFPEAAYTVCDAFAAAIAALKLRESDYVCVITRGHRWDADCLRQIFSGAMPSYLGMIGSKRRTAGLLNLLEGEGFDRAQLDAIHTPIGLDIGALSVKEIAISIVAELIACRRADTNRRSHSSIMTSEDIDLPLLRYVADERIDKVLLLVYDTSGSTPVKSGAFMAVDSSTKFMGTIGGGCSESAVLRQAYYLIGTGESRSVSIDMSNDVAEKEGMVCGGQMKVLLADLSKR